MSARPRTDASASIVATEFVWDTDEHTEVHRFVTAPILALLSGTGARTVLDLGCGNGSLTALVARAGYAVTGLDHSQSGVRLAANRYPEASFEQQDLVEPLPEDHIGQYDAVISVEVVEHLLLPRRLIDNAFSALRPGGMLIVTTPYHGYWKNLALALTNRFDSHWHPLRDYGHVKFFSLRTLRQLLVEHGFSEPGLTTVGRIPVLARSIIASAIKPR